jgi:hypothetical protein
MGQVTLLELTQPVIMLVMRRVMNWAIQMATTITSATISSVDRDKAAAVWARLCWMASSRPALGLEGLVPLGDGQPDALGRLGGGPVKVIHVGADGHEAEAAPGFTVLTGVIGNGRRGGELPEAEKKTKKEPEPPCSVSSSRHTGARS